MMMQSQAEQSWHQLSIDETIKYLETDLTTGLSTTEVPQLQERYGLNELQAKAGKSAIVRFLMEFNQPLIYILVVAGVIALLLKDWVDAGVILGVISCPLI
jgi:Ca2+-transporting ATPase